MAPDRLLPLALLLLALALACGDGAPAQRDGGEPYLCEPLHDDVEVDVYAVYRSVLESFWLQEDSEAIVLRERTHLDLVEGAIYLLDEQHPPPFTQLEDDEIAALRQANVQSVALEPTHLLLPVPVFTIDDELLEQISGDGHEQYMRRLELLYGKTRGVLTLSRPAFNCSRSTALLWLQAERGFCGERPLGLSLRKEAGAWRIVGTYAHGSWGICN